MGKIKNGNMMVLGLAMAVCGLSPLFGTENIENDVDQNGVSVAINQDKYPGKNKENNSRRNDGETNDIQGKFFYGEPGNNIYRDEIFEGNIREIFALIRRHEKPYWERAVAAIQFLLNQDPESINRCFGEYGITFLHAAASEGILPLVAFLIQKGANVNAKSKGGFTPLYGAVRKGHLVIVKYLLRRAADLASEFPEGNLVDLAYERGHAELGKLLKPLVKIARLGIKFQERLFPRKKIFKKKQTDDPMPALKKRIKEDVLNACRSILKTHLEKLRENLVGEEEITQS
jgi:hypothetical protein